MPLGAHVRSSGGLSQAVGRAQAIGAECLQVFLSAPQQWRGPAHADAEVERFAQLCREADPGLGPNFVHAIYLINLASGDPLIRERSIAALTSCVEWAGRCGLTGAVVHIGSSRGQSVAEAETNLVSALREVLSRASGEALVVLENSAGSGETLGARVGQIGSVLERLDRDPRLGVCVDTAHALASGYDIRSAAGLDGLLEELERHVGLERLRLIHANDSKAPLGSAVDRHENIGRGEIGEEAFERMLRHPALRDRAWVLEVPGFSNEGPDAESVAILKRLAGRDA